MKQRTIARTLSSVIYIDRGKFFFLISCLFSKSFAFMNLTFDKSWSRDSNQKVLINRPNEDYLENTKRILP